MVWYIKMIINNYKDWSILYICISWHILVTANLICGCVAACLYVSFTLFSVEVVPWKVLSRYLHIWIDTFLMEKFPQIIED